MILVMQDFAPRRATYADLEAVPPHLVAEIIDGELITMPRPRLRHAVTYSSLGGLLCGPFQFGLGGPGGWWILDEPELHLNEDVVVPDVAGWRWERMPEVPDEPFATMAPDWVCEILSPRTEKLDRGPKRAIYARHGVKHLWFVDVKLQSLETYELVAGVWQPLAVHSGSAPVAAPPFVEVPLPLELLWRTARP
jgi:Uma2 family endonuclease